MKLNDEAIGQIAKILQVAILTGTDIVDNLRTLELEVQGETLTLTSEYKTNFDKNLQDMLQEKDSLVQ